MRKRSAFLPRPLIAAAMVAATAVSFSAQSAVRAVPEKPAADKTSMQEKPAATAKPPAGPPVPSMTRYNMTAGDLNGDGFAEAIVYDSTSKAIRVTDYSGQSPIQSLGIDLKDPANTMVVADVDGDGNRELIVGHGLGGYNLKTGPQTDVSISIYTPAAKTDWKPVEIYRKATERPEVTTLKVKDFDGDGRPEILFGYFASKYMNDLRVAKLEAGKWTITELPSIRMGGHFDAGDVLGAGRPQVVVGRAYGDPVTDKDTTVLGDAFLLDGDKRIPLPVTRGVSAVAVGDLDGDKRAEVVVADGWHTNYGKIARCRLAVLAWQQGQWKYELIEDLPDHIRFEEIELVDLTGDRRPEIVGLAARAASLGGTVRVYQRTGGRWRGRTAAFEAQTFAAGDFDNDQKAELVFAGQPPLPVALGAAPSGWDTRLGEEIKTFEVDARTLVGKPAPPLKATEWIGSAPTTLTSLKGKVVMLDFWATWCKPCIEMYPQMREWVKNYGPDGFVVLGITNHSSQTTAKVRTFLAKHKLPWAVAIDPKNGTHMSYGVSPIPHTILIDRQGIVRLTHVGGGDLTKIEAKLQELLGDKGGVR